jgi:hypothetical protein
LHPTPEQAAERAALAPPPPQQQQLTQPAQHAVAGADASCVVS